MGATFKQDAINIREELNNISGITGRVSEKADTVDTVLILPTTDPAIAGALWNNAGVVNISTG